MDPEPAARRSHPRRARRCPASRATTSVAGDRELAERPSALGPIGDLLEDDAPDLFRGGNDRRDAPAAARSRDVASERVDDVLHPFIDLVDVERARPEKERDTQLERIAVAIADAAARLRFEHGSVDTAAPLVARRRVSGQDGADRETSLRHWNTSLATPVGCRADRVHADRGERRAAGAGGASAR